MTDHLEMQKRSYIEAGGRLIALIGPKHKPVRTESAEVARRCVCLIGVRFCFVEIYEVGRVAWTFQSRPAPLAAWQTLVTRDS